MADRDQGSFIGGFTIGMFAGALGYFLFATNKGKKIKTELVKEWTAARTHMPDRGEGMTQFASFRDVLTHIRDQIESSTTEAEQKINRQPKKKGSPKKASRFKGV